MTKVAYLIEGDMEQEFVRKTCPGCKVQRINCNGDDVSLEAIAERVGSLGRLAQKRFPRIIVLVDRERREASCEGIECKLRELLEKQGLSVPFTIGVADRETENWILADYEMFKSTAKVDVAKDVTTFEGMNGKAKIKKILGPERRYVETVDGVAWLKASRPAIMKENSPSFARFADAISDLNCRWMNRQQALPFNGCEAEM